MNIIKTGSVAQDALRLGFQTTCDAGIVSLLKIHDITVEACAAFKERHLKEVENLMKDFISRGEEHARTSFLIRMKRCSYDFERSFESRIPFLAQSRINKYKAQLALQKPPDIAITNVEVSDPELNFFVGNWITRISYTVTSPAWSGLFDGNYSTFAEETKISLEQVITEAKVCVVKYTPYDNYSERYIPDEVVALALQAKKIGMTDLCVATPIITDSPKPPKDPIIVGHVGDQMFLIAMFGQDVKDHMSFNM